jgi:hypothetical protein
MISDHYIPWHWLRTPSFLESQRKVPILRLQNLNAMENCPSRRRLARRPHRELWHNSINSKVVRTNP